MRMLVAAVLAEEGQKHGAKNVEGGQAGGDGAGPVHPGRAIVGGDEDGVFTEEAGCRRDAGDGDGGAHQRPEGDGNFFRRPPMLRMSCSPESAWMTLPAPRKSSALKKAWVIRW